MGVAEVVEKFSENILNYAVLLAAVGTVTMALIELLKSVFDLRMRYNRWRVRKWVGADALAELEAMCIGSARPAGERSVIGVLVGEIEFSGVLYDQPTEKMMSQLQAAANLALDFPGRYEKLYRFLTGGTAQLGDDAKRWYDYAKKVAEGKAGDDDARPATQARARLGLLVTRSLDSFQNETQYLWAELNQRAAVISAGVFIFWLLFIMPQTPEWKFDLLRALVLAFAGGLVAPFAKDVVSALSGLTAKAR